MKKMISSALLTLVLASAIAPQPVYAMEIVAIVVGGSVTTVALSVPFAITNGRFKGEAFQQALDVVAAGDASLMTPAVAAMISDLKAKHPEFSQIDEVELLEAVLTASFVE